MVSYDKKSQLLALTVTDKPDPQLYLKFEQLSCLSEADRSKLALPFWYPFEITNTLRKGLCTP
jgi:hypothetical protein